MKFRLIRVIGIGYNDCFRINLKVKDSLKNYKRGKIK